VKAQLFDSERKVMEVLWHTGDTTAKDLARTLGEQVGWSKTTTYTVIKKCIDKGFIERRGTDFLCHALISKDEVRERETAELVDKMFDGSFYLLVAFLIRNSKTSPEQIEELRALLMGMG